MPKQLPVNPSAPLAERVRVVVAQIRELADAEHKARLTAVEAVREHNTTVDNHNRRLMLLRDMFLANMDEVHAEEVPLNVSQQGTVTYRGKPLTYRRKLNQ